MPDTTLATDLFSDQDFFLSAINPTATADQRDLEALALELVKSPIIVDAQAQATTRFKIMAGSDIPAEALEGIDDKMAEWAFHYVILALNSDANYPKVLGHGYGPPHEWFGMQVPGCRGLGTGENPDNHYSFVPVDGNSHFELHGKLSTPRVGDCPMFITSTLSQSTNVAWLDWRNVEIVDDGTFVVTIGPEPADGRPNHLQTSIDSKYLFIRDGRQHWDQVPNAYRINRLDSPTAPPRTIDQLIQVAKRFIIDDVAMNYWFKQMVGFLPPNSITGPANSSGVGGMQTQKLLRGRLSLADDDAYVLTLHAGGSDYWVLTLYDWWLMSGNFWSRTSCLNNSQSVANPDGSHTYVFSITDPGVHNWVDTLGLHETLFMQRWQLLPPADRSDDDRPWAGGEPSAHGALVKLSELKTVLPEGTRWVTPQEREQQLAERFASFQKRHIV
jgi:Protein of unknown function (DUF1214)